MLARCVMISAAITSCANAQFQVSQFDPGAGEYAVLGEIEAYATPLSAEDFYNWDGANPDLPPGAPATVTQRSHLFLIESAIDGLCVVFIHDRPADSGGGRAETSWSIYGDADGADWLVQDGPAPNPNDSYTGGPGDSDFTAKQIWPSQNSDGGIIGAIDGMCVLEAAFTDVEGGPGNEIVGLNAWVAYSSTGATVTLVLEVDRPVRIRPTPTPDLDGDGDVDGADLAFLLGAWSTDDPCVDFTGDGNVDGQDLALLLGGWG